MASLSFYEIKSKKSSQNDTRKTIQVPKYSRVDLHSTVRNPCWTA